MKSSLKMQFSLLFKRKELYLALMIMIILVIYCFANECMDTFGSSYYNLNSAIDLFYLRGHKSFAGIMITLYPLMIVLPFADSFITDYKSKVLPVVQTRVKFKDYYFSKMICVFIGATMVLLIPQLLDMLLNGITFPHTSLASFTNTLYGQGYVGTLSSMAFPNLLYNNPYLYTFLFVFAFSITGGIMAVGIYCLSFILKKSRLLILCVLFILGNISTFLGNYTNHNFDINMYILPCVSIFPKSYIYPICFYLFFIVMIVSLSILILKKYKTNLL